MAGGNHGSQIAQLPTAERTRATALVPKWAGLGDGDRAVRQLGRAGALKHGATLDKKPDYLRRGL